MECHINDKPFEKDNLPCNNYDRQYYFSESLCNNFTMAGISQCYNYGGLSYIGSAKTIFPSINLVDR